MSIRKTIFDLHSLEFLNAPISQIYHRKKHFVNGKDLSFLKGMLSADLVQIERGFRYVYFSDISLESDRIDQRLFREQFPFLFERFANKCYSIYNADGSQKIVDGITYYTWMLERFRNINLHAIISTPLSNTMRIDESFIQAFPKIAESISYVKNGELTIAGMMIMVLAALSQNDSKSFLCNFVNIWGKSIWGDIGNDSINEYRNTLELLFADTFRNNYEVDIREKNNDKNILESIFGRIYHDVQITMINQNTQRFFLDLSERVKAPRFCVSGQIEMAADKCILTVDKGSNIGKYFDKDYVLKIYDVKAFSAICQCTPPFLGVAYLYHNNITELKDISDVDMERLSKLNKPKFYRNKNITILCCGANFSDMREINKSASEGVQKALLNIEEKFVFELGIPVYNTYSKLSVVLNKLNAPLELVSRLIVLRNFAAHYGMLNDYYFYNRETGYYLDLPYIFSAFNDLIAYLDSMGYHNYADYVRKNYYYHIINNLIGVKYKRIFQKSILLFRRYGDKVIDCYSDIDRSLKTANSSIIDSETERIIVSCSPDRFNFNIPSQVYQFKDSKFYFDRLTLIRIQGRDLSVNNVALGKDELVFFKTPATNFSKIKSNGKGVVFDLINSYEEGILTIQTYKIKEQSV